MSAVPVPVTPALAGALRMLDLGVHVQPCRITIRASDGKKILHDLTDGWQSHGAAREHVLAAFAKGANAYLICCGPSGIAVADLDVKDGINGIASWDGRPQGGIVVRTRSGGLHRYFLNDVGIGNKEGVLPGVDVRGVGGGVFGPGSLDDAYEIVSWGSLTPWSLTGIAVDTARPKMAVSEKAVDGFFQTSVTPDKAKEIVTVKLNEVVSHARWGWSGFRTTLMRAALTLGGYVGSGFLSASDAQSWLAAAIRYAGQEPDEDDLKWIEQGLADGERRPFSVITPLVRARRALTPSGSNLPDEFWKSRPVLEHIRSAAHSRGRSADAVLGAVLARLSSLLPGDLRVDTGVAMPASLNFYSILLGGPSTGKSTAANLAEVLFPFGYDSDSKRCKIGSGQGIAAAYGSIVEGEFKQSQTKALFFAHEGSTLLRLAKQRENTTLDTLREAWTGDEIGQKNAAAERDRRVAHYALGFWVGMQPIHAIEMFSDVNVGDGTLQRFVWFSATDPSIPEGSQRRRAMPQPMPVDLSVMWSREPITLPAHIESEIAARDTACGRGEVQVDPGQEHATLRQIKTACLLTLLDGRRAVADEDWVLAGAVLACSDAVAQSVRDAAKERVRAAEARKIAARHRMLDADEARDEKKIENLAVRALEKIKDVPGIARGALVRSLSRDRDAAEVAVERLVDRELVREEPSGRGTRLHPQ